MKKTICQNCGDEFEYSRGQIQTFCKKKECLIKKKERRAKQSREWQKAHYKKKVPQKKRKKSKAYEKQTTGKKYSNYLKINEMKEAKKLIVDKDMCIGCYACVNMYPECFTVVDDKCELIAETSHIDKSVCCMGAIRRI